MGQKMDAVRLEGRLGKIGHNLIIQKVETVRNIDGKVEHYIACYKPDKKCEDRKTYSLGGIEISKYCPFTECKKH